MQFAKSKIFIIRLFTEKVCYACSRVTEGRLLPGGTGMSRCELPASSQQRQCGGEVGTRVLNSVNLLRTYYIPDTGDKAESETRLCPRKVTDSLRKTREGACHYHTERNTLGMSVTARGTAPLTRKFPGTCEVKRGKCCKRGAGTALEIRKGRWRLCGRTRNSEGSLWMVPAGWVGFRQAEQCQPKESRTEGEEGRVSLLPEPEAGPLTDPNSQSTEYDLTKTL